MNAKTGLVLEGGGMRGVFTIGVLDAFMDEGIRFPYGVGVSAGACHGMSFLSGQRGRAKQASIDFLERYDYLGIKFLFQQRAIFDMEALYERVPRELYPFDYAAAFANPMRYEVVTTNCLTGRAEYHSETSDAKRILHLCRASSSLPFVAPICTVDGIPMLDGGITDPIPIERAIAQGFSRNVVVLTREREYRSGRDVKMPRFVYKRYPRLRVALSRMERIYNAKVELVQRLEESGRVLAIRPERHFDVGRLEKNTDKLRALYDHGYATARRVISSSEAAAFLDP